MFGLSEDYLAYNLSVQAFYIEKIILIKNNLNLPDESTNLQHPTSVKHLITNSSFYTLK